MNGSLSLRVGSRGGRSVLLDCAATYPIRVLRPRVDPSDGGLALTLLMLSGGLLDDDHHTLDVVVEEGARLALWTQAATQLHRGASRQTLQIHVSAGATFSYLPHALVPHAGARYTQSTRVQAALGARVFVAETLAPGRVAYGEAHAYRELRLGFDGVYDDVLVARERVCIRPDPSLLPALLGPFSHAASGYVLGPGAPEIGDGSLGADVPSCLDASGLAHGGWHVRGLARRAADLDAALRSLHHRWLTGAPSIAGPDGTARASEPHLPAA